MSLIGLTIAVIIGICLYAGLHFLLNSIYSSQTNSPNYQYLFFSLMSFSVIGYMGAELIAYQAQDAQSYVLAFKWRGSFGLIFLSIWPWFVYRYTEIGSRIIVWLLSLYFLLFLFIHIYSPYGSNFDELPVIISQPLPWGELITFHEHRTINLSGLMIWAGILALVSYTFYACFRQYRRGHRYQGMMLAIAMAVFSAFVFENLLVRAGILNFIFLAQYGFPALIVIMGFALHHKTNEHIQHVFDVMNHVPAVMYMKEPNGKYLMVNQQFESLFNIKSANIIGNTDFDAFDKELADIFFNNDRKVLAQGNALEFEEVARHGDGSLHRYHSIKFPLADKTGELYAVCGISTDITEKKQMDEAISKAQERYRNLVESTAAIPWELDLNTWCFTYVGPQAEDLLGYPVEQWYKKDFWITHIYSEDRDEAVNFCQTSSSQGNDHEFEYRMVTADGNIVWLQDFVQVIREDGKPVRLQGYMFDITERKSSQIKIQQSETMFRNLFETAGDAIFLMHGDTFIDCNKKTLQMFACNREDIIGKSPVFFSPATQYDGQDSSTLALEKINKALNGQTQFFEWQHIRLDGTPFDAEVSLNCLELEGEVCVQAIVHDVTTRRRSEEALRTIAVGVTGQSGALFYEQLVQSLGKLFAAKYAFIALLDDNDRMQVNTLAVSVDGKISDNISYRLEQTPCENVVGHHTCCYPKNIQQLFPEDKLLHDMGVESYIGSPLFNVKNEAIGLVVVLDNKPMEEQERINTILDIFTARAAAELERMEAEMHIRRMAFEDYLTCLPNRAALHEYMKTTLNRSLQKGISGAMILIDLDHFKTINDALSHDVGDQVLKLIGQRLQDLADEHVYLARIGGDEFVAVLSDEQNKGEELFAKHARNFAAKIVEELCKPLYLDSRILNVGASVGVVTFPQQGKSELDIMRRADMALYRAKNRGRGNVQFYEPQLQEDVDQRLQIERGLRHAIENRELELHFQPQINTQGDVIGAETLLRWYHPELGQVPPDRFIPIAEESGLIHSIGEWVIIEACRLLHEWQQNNKTFPAHLAINISAWQFANPDIVSLVLESMQKYQLQPQQIVLELTETALLYDLQDTIDKLEKFRRSGIQIALDDFGTGYSSLAYLKDMPMDILKIDKAFIQELITDNVHPLVETIITMGQHMNLIVIAEGVETQEQRNIITGLGCDIFQGYFFARPMSADDFLGWLRQHQ